MLKYFSPREIKPNGWLKRQLEIEANGLCGNLDKMWPDVRDSAWIGGSREGWERVPYWLDGFIPLAYLLEDRDMIARAEKYVNAIIERQAPSGWICPCSEEKIPKYDVWAVFLIGKVLTVYHSYSGSRRAINALYKAMRNLYDLMKVGTVKLFEWGKFRWYECFIPIKYLYDKRCEGWMLELAHMLRKEGADYSEFYDLWKEPLNRWRLDTHVVNVVMELKSEAVERALFGESLINAEERYAFLKKYNGTAVETLTGDECLGGVDNNRGTELCSVNELMYSFEWLYQATGKAVWLDRLERAAFNALPAAFSKDMWTHQYVQMVNQIDASTFEGKSFFGTNTSEAHIFGLEPHYGCCTANGAQGYPKLCTSVFAKGRGSVICTMMLPAELDTRINGADVKVRIDTRYPFRHSAKYTVSASSAVKFKLKIRIPSWSSGISLNGVFTESKGYITIDKEFFGEETFEVELFGKPRLVTRPYDLKCAEWGPLVFALPIKGKATIKEYEKKGVTRKFPYCDYETKNDGEWRYGFASDELKVVFAEGDDYPYSCDSPSVTLAAKLSRVDWRYAEGYTSVSNRTPASRKALSPAEEAILIPYGAAKLRMTEMPKVK